MSSEQVIEFGPERRWVGVLSRPPADAPANSQRVALLLTNSGIIHRVGPNRLHVRLARFLAAAGVPAFRYDLPGIGDSESTVGNSDVGQSNLAATMLAMSTLERMGVAQRFIIFGICSGANHAFHAALADPRVVGAIMIDPTSVFSTPRHRMLSFLAGLRRGFRLRALRRLAGGKVRSVLRHAPDPGAPVLLHRKRNLPEWSAANDAFATLTRRGTRLLFVMTRHNSRVYTYEAQMRDGFPEIEALDRMLTCVRYRDAEHTFTLERHRELLENALLGWMGALANGSGATSVRPEMTRDGDHRNRGGQPDREELPVASR